MHLDWLDTLSIIGLVLVLSHTIKKIVYEVIHQLETTNETLRRSNYEQQTFNERIARSVSDIEVNLRNVDQTLSEIHVEQMQKRGF